MRLVQFFLFAAVKTVKHRSRGRKKTNFFKNIW